MDPRHPLPGNVLSVWVLPLDGVEQEDQLTLFHCATDPGTGELLYVSRLPAFYRSMTIRVDPLDTEVEIRQ